MTPERQYPVRESGVEYLAGLAVPCRQGTIAVKIAGVESESDPPGALSFTPEKVSVDTEGCLASIRVAAERRGDILPLPWATSGTARVAKDDSL